MARSDSPMSTVTPPSPDAGPDGLAVIFPGQGSQVPGVGRAWVDHPAWAVLDRIEEAAGRPLRPLLLDAKADLSRTEDSQLSVLTASLVAWEATRPHLDLPVAFAGHSLGQITALIAAGAVSIEDGVRLALVRARVTQQCADDTPGGLIALLGATAEQADAAVAGVDEAWVANDNAPGQLVIGGTPAGLESAAEAAKAAGVRRVRALPVGGAFHTPLMAAAADAFRPTVEATGFLRAATPVVTNHDARPHQDEEGWADRLTSHLVRPVRWRESVDALAEVGARRLVELGPGTTLAGLVRRCRDDVDVSSAATPDEVEQLLPRAAGSRRPMTGPDPRPTVPPNAPDARRPPTPGEVTSMSPNVSLEGDDVRVPTRMILAPEAGTFRPSPPETRTTEGEILERGASVGTLESLGRTIDIRSAFDGFLMGMMALPGERVRAGQPVAWLHAIGGES